MARLEKRRRLWYAVRDIPKQFQKKIGKRRFIRSTGTGDRAKAELIMASYDVVWLERIDRARNGPTPEATGEQTEARLRRQAAFWRDRINNAAPSSRPLIIEQMKDAASQEIDPYNPDDPVGVRKAELFVELALGEHVAEDAPRSYASSAGFFEGFKCSECDAVPPFAVSPDASLKAAIPFADANQAAFSRSVNGVAIVRPDCLCLEVCRVVVRRIAVNMVYNLVLSHIDVVIERVHYVSVRGAKTFATIHNRSGLVTFGSG